MSLPTANAVRVAGRLTVAFLLDFAEIGRGDRTLVDAVLMLAMVQANIAPVLRETDLQRAYAAYSAPVPDGLRRPTSVSSLANSLRLPYETVRRRVADMARRGLCVVTPAGAYVPQEVLSRPEHMAGAFRTYDLLRTFYYELYDLGVMPPKEPPEGPLLEPAEQVRAIMRVLGDYILRSVDSVTATGRDMITGLVLLGVFRANIEHRMSLEEGLPGAAMLPDGDRRPVSAAALAARLNLPAETVRRHAAQLVAQGECVRGPHGLLVTSGIIDRPQVLGLVHDNFTHLTRMFSSLAQLGVLAAWDAARPAAPARPLPAANGG